MISNSPIWQKLQKNADDLKHRHLRDLFAKNRTPYAPFALRHDGILLDIGKQRISTDTLKLLHALARETGIKEWIAKMLAGEKINHTEHRAVRHMDLRRGESAPPEVREVLKRMENLTAQVQSGKWRGFSGERITDIVNLGIGGSDLGPRMVVIALSALLDKRVNVHFISNVDGADMAKKLAKLKAESTLFIISSKSFTTQETMKNAQSARAWLLNALKSEKAVARHFVAATNNIAAAKAFGLLEENLFPLWDWVGGRFSLWSAIGLPIMFAVGALHFYDLLKGAHAMDCHFETAEIEENLPIHLALLTLWNSNFLHAPSFAVFPYAQSLTRFPRYLQQLEMESLGKTVDRNAKHLDITTSPIVWGTAGTNGQHSYFQLLHQGAQTVACDFIAFAKADFQIPGHHEILLANCLAQSAALAFGQEENEARGYGIDEALLPYRTFTGNQPSSTIILPELSPFYLGELLALYEHKVFALGVLWNLNAFDQWGVELGKHLANQIKPYLEGQTPPKTLDISTTTLLEHLKQCAQSS